MAFWRKRQIYGVWKTEGFHPLIVPDDLPIMATELGIVTPKPVVSVEIGQYPQTRCKK
jgi:hypothetical protein